MSVTLIVHGHFYQPPRESPWTGIVEREPSAAPFHDWNERIHHECYRRNAFARILDERGAVRRIVSTYERLSFNFGPTLLSWLERHQLGTLRRILEADRHSARALGHGNAIAQGYNHAILPLCNERDLRTQIRWGIAEFRHRFGRAPDALWLPETACDERVLTALVEEGLRWVLLAPGQAAAVRENGAWRDVPNGSIDPRRAYQWLHPDGRSIALFFYDAPVSRAVAFDGVLGSSHALMDRIERAAGPPGTLVHLATDGESYGHHFRHGERGLAYALEVEAQRRGFEVSNYGAWLDQHPPELEVRLAAGEEGKGTSWSCAHGVGRWMRDCGCQGGGKAGWTQKWRAPLRNALDALRDEGARFYEEAAGALCRGHGDPWALRDAYVALVLDPHADRGAFFERELGRKLDDAERERALSLLEMQRASMTMYTSCGWFFSELTGIETVQVLRYAGHMLDQLEELGGPPVRARFLELLAEAHSNLPERGNGADVFHSEVAAARVTRVSLAAHLCLSGVVCDLPPAGEVAGHRYRLDDFAKRQRGRIELATARISLEHLATGHKSALAAAGLHLGDADLHCVLRSFDDLDAYAAAIQRVWEAFDDGTLFSLLRAIEAELGLDHHGIDAVLPSGRVAISRAIFAERRPRYAAQLDAIFEDNRLIMAMFVDAGLPLPQELATAAEVALRERLESAMALLPEGGFDETALAEALAVVELAKRYGCTVASDLGRQRVERELGRLLHHVAAGSVDRSVSTRGSVTGALRMLSLAERLGLDVDLERAQEQLYRGLALGLEPSTPLSELGERLGLSAELFQLR